MAHSPFSSPDFIEELGRIVEREQLGRKPLGENARYEGKVADRGLVPDSRRVGEVIYAPYAEAMQIIREVDDELTAEAESRGENRDKGYFLEQLESLVAEVVDDWLLENGAITEADGAVTIVKARNAVKTALDVYHGVDAFLDIEIPGRFRDTVTMDITTNPDKLSGDKRAKADLVLAPIQLPERRRAPRDPSELAHWREMRASARTEIKVLAKRILRGLLADRGLWDLARQLRTWRRRA